MTKKFNALLLFFLLPLIFSEKLVAQEINHLVWEIGEKDNRTDEFALSKSGYTNYRTTFKEGIVLYNIGKNNSQDIPFVLPGPSDSWAGNRGQLIIRFGLQNIENSTLTKLRLNLVEVHPVSPPQLDIDVNGFVIKVKTPKGNNSGYLNRRQTASKDLFVDVDIPANKLKKGDNIITIRNAAGSWLVFDNIELRSDKSVTLGKTRNSISVFSAVAISALLNGKEGKLSHPIKLQIANWDNKQQPIDIYINDKLSKNTSLTKGLNTIEVTVPETNVEQEVNIKLLSKNNKVGETDIKIKPVKKWTMYLVQHTHTDIGYTKPQTEILTEHLRYIDYAIEYCELTENYPDDAKFRWTCEASWAVREYLKNRPKEQIDKLKKWIDKGQIEVTAMFFNMSEIVDENSFKTFLEPIREFKKHGIPVLAGMQNDVNGIAWCLTDYLPDLGVKYLTIGEHGHRALIPFDKPTVFKWESPSGKPIYTYRPDHYNTGNFFGIESGDADLIAPKLLNYLTNLEERNYPFDAVAAQYSGYFTDNSPPSIIENKFIEEWNKKYAYPKLRSALASEFLDYVTNNYRDKLETYRVAYPDWWTDGFGSAARETGASRKTHSDMITVEGMLSMAKMKGRKLPDNIEDRLRHIHESLLFYDEHTFGYSESVRDPMAESTHVQWAEKSAYVWEGLKSAQMLYETSIGLIQNDLARTKNPTITFFNTLNWKRSEMITAYIDFEVIPRDKAFKVIDENGKTLKTQPLRSRREGTYYAIYAEDIPAMGYKTYEIIIDESQPSTPVTSTGEITSIENEYYIIKVDAKKGAIESIYDKKLQTELVDNNAPWQLGAFIYETLDNRYQMERYTFTDYKREGLSDVKITNGINGPIYQTINITGKSPGCDENFGVKIEIRLYHHTKNIELAYAIRRLPVTDPTGIYIAFPFKRDDAKLLFDVQGGVVAAGEDQLTGTSTGWNTVQNFVTARNGKAQFIVSSDLIPLYQLGNMLDGPFQYKKSYEKPHAYSWVMNNYWVTNFKASQDGEFHWSYRITSSDDTSDTKASKFGWSNRVPLYARVMPTGKDNGKPRSYSAFSIDSDNLLMTSCTPSIDNNSVLLNVRELDGNVAKLRILDENGKALTFCVVNALNEKMGNEVKELDFKGYENKFIRVNIK